MRALVLTTALSAAYLAGCADIMGNHGADAGSSSTSSGADAGDAASAAQGALCDTDPVTGATLCAALSLCPDIVIDQRNFPGCGFRVSGNAIDMECACEGDICPIGTATTCAQAKQLLSSQSQPTVCAQVGEGRCVTQRAAGGKTGGSSSTCDQSCAAECGSSVTCRQLCGC